MTEASHALYRKYRPQKFKEVKNQEHIVSVLEGAIAKNMIPHALLFTGSRGTGKTTVARIFAHEIGAKDVDIYEIDAASNRGIDDIRALKEAVHTLPYESPYKVYIIDEVHMLTKEAFNALLKTLEEPPEFVVFILATTERDKLLDTITSRCQVFDFHAPTREQLRKLVEQVAKKEDCKMDSHAADVIAIAADGSYRDALGITQKVMMSSGDKELTADEVALIVSAPKSELLNTLVIALSSKDTSTALSTLETVSNTHTDIKLFYKLLLERLRTVMLLRNIPSQAKEILSHYGPEDAKILETLSTQSDSALNSHLLKSALSVGEYIGKTFVPTLPLELLVIEHCRQV